MPTWGYPSVYTPEWDTSRRSSNWRWWQHALFWVGAAVLIAVTKGAATKGVLAVAAKVMKVAKVVGKLAKGLKVGTHITVGVAGYFGASVLHESLAFDEINWGVVAARTIFGAIDGGISGSVVSKGLKIALGGGVGFSRSIAIDLVETGDFSQVRWDMALLMGAVGAAGAAGGIIPGELFQKFTKFINTAVEEIDIGSIMSVI